MSSPTYRSAPIPAPPPVVRLPVEALVEAVVTEILTFKFSSISFAGVVPKALPNPIT